MTEHFPTGVLDISDAYIPRNLTLSELDIIHESGERDPEPTIMMTLLVSPIARQDETFDVKYVLGRSAIQQFAQSILDGLRNLDDQD